MCRFFVTFVLAAILSTCKGQHVNTCNVVPKDQYIEVGSDTEVWCQTACVRSKVFWKLNKTLISESLSNTINASHTVLTLRNFTHHTATIECHSADTQQILGGTIIKTYSKPSNISCMLDYENQERPGIPTHFICNWEHQNSSSTINYTLLASTPADPQQEICHSQEPKCIFNLINKENKKIYVGSTITVTVRATTPFWEADSDPHEFVSTNIIKIIPPKLDISVSSDHLLVEWKRAVSDIQCHCEVSYSKVVGDGPPKVLKQTLNTNENGKVKIEEVESCTNYRISGRCALDKAFWSNWSREKTVLTKLNGNNVRLRLWRKVAEPDKNGVRKVHVMWTGIPSTCQGTFTYTIKQIPYKENMTGVNYTDTLCSNSTCDIDVNQDAYRIRLTVFHDTTLLSEDIYVPAVGESLPQVADIQNKTNEGVILVSWKAPVEPVTGYMIDWTHNGNQYYWKESKYTNTTLFDLLDNKRYNITVTPLLKDKTGHGTQALQVCSRVGEPGNFTFFHVRVVSDKSAHVSWSMSQEECSGAVINYIVFYSTQTGPTRNVTVDNSKQDIILKDLSPDTQYSIYAEATAHTGTTRSIERDIQTRTFDPWLIQLMGISGGLVIILVLFLGLCCAIQWKKFREKPVPNPGLSSVALWPSSSDQKSKGLSQAFSVPYESDCDRVYTEDIKKASTPQLPSGSNSIPASDQTEEYTNPAEVLGLVVQDEKPAERVETQQLGSSGERTALLSCENSSFNPYRSQTSVEIPAPRTIKQCKRVPVKQQEKIAPQTVYVTLNMLEQSQG